MTDLLLWVAALPIGPSLRAFSRLVPWLQVVHILANGVILGAVVMIDMRVWGVSRSQATIAMARRFQVWIWGALAMLTVSGFLLIFYSPRRALTDLAFQVKMWSMVIAIVVTVAFLFALRSDGKPTEAGASRLAGLLGTLTLALWVFVTLAGRGRWFALMMSRMLQ
jgi:uncharacterized membrane protein